MLGYRYIDLTVPLGVDTPVYPGDPPVVIETLATLSRDGWSEHRLSFATHVGTHIDAPAHMLEGGQTLAQYPLERFVGRGVYLDVRSGFDGSAVAEAGLQAGDIVLLHTGMAEHFHEPAYFESAPSLPPQFAQHLIDAHVSIVGLDMMGPDEPPFPIHQQLLGAGVLIIENLTGLDALAGHTFTVIAWPLKLDLDGSPARVVAQLKD
jgi:kynurenine formamidase